MNKTVIRFGNYTEKHTCASTQNLCKSCVINAVRIYNIIFGNVQTRSFETGRDHKVHGQLRHCPEIRQKFE